MIELIVTAAFWTLVIIHGFFEGWRLSITMACLWIIGFLACSFIPAGCYIFLAVQAVLSLILMTKSGISSFG